MTKLNSVAIALSVIVVLIAAVVLLVPKTPHVARTCLQRQAELQVVANIANATGQAPGSPRSLYGTRFSVRPNLCVVIIPGTPGQPQQSNVQGTKGTDSTLRYDASSK